MASDTERIREYLTKYYGDDELGTFCFDHFRAVYDNFGIGRPKGQKIQDLIEYCQRRQCMPDLLTQLELDRPDQYRKWFGEEVAESGRDGGALPKPQRKPREFGAFARVVYVIVTVIVFVLGAVVALCYLFSPPATVALLTDHDKYVAVTDVGATWKLKGIAEHPDERSRFTLLCVEAGKATFQFEDRFVSARDNARDWELRAEVKIRDAWEEFQLSDPETGDRLSCRTVLLRLHLGKVKLAFRTAHGTWVGAMEQDRDWVLRAETTKLSTYEKFIVIKTADPSE